MSLQPARKGLLGNKIEASPYFPNGYAEIDDPFSVGKRSVIGTDLCFTLPQTAASVFIQPSQSGLGEIGGAGNPTLIFEIGANANLVKIDSIKMSLTFSNTSLVDAYIAPSPAWFNKFTLSTTSAQSDTNWTDESVPICGYHMECLRYLERNECLKILKEEGFSGVNSIGEESVDVQYIPGVSKTYTTKQAIYPNIRIPAGTTAVYSFYILGSYITEQSFLLDLLSGSQKLTIAPTFKPGFLWMNANNAVTVTRARLTLEGKRTDNANMDIIRDSLATPNRSLTIPYHRSQFQKFDASFFAGQSYTFQLSSFTGLFSALSFYLGPAQPSTSSSPTTQAGSAQYLQNITPSVDINDLVAPAASTYGAGNDGSLYAIDNFSFKYNGFDVYNTPNLSSEDLNVLAMSCTANQSYLIPLMPAWYTFPFSANLREDVLHGSGFKHGAVKLVGNSTLEFSCRNTLPAGTCLYVFGIRCVELYYDDGHLAAINGV